MPFNEAQLEATRTLLVSDGWNGVVKPSIARWANEAIKALILQPSERGGVFKTMTDDAIRERIRAAEWLLSAFANEVAVADFNRRLDELQGQPAGGEPAAQVLTPPPANPEGRT